MDLGGVGPRPEVNFLEYGHVAYQIKANDVCSNMVTNILTPSTRGVGGGVKRSNHIFF